MGLPGSLCVSWLRRWGWTVTDCDVCPDHVLAATQSDEQTQKVIHFA